MTEKPKNDWDEPISTPKAIAMAASEVALALHVVTIALARDKVLDTARLAQRVKRMSSRAKSDRHPITKQMLENLATALRSAARRRPRR